MENINKNSAARIKANNKYNAKAYINKLIRFKPEQLEDIEKYIEKYNYTFNSAVVTALLYCIENDIQINANTNK